MPAVRALLLALALSVLAPAGADAATVAFQTGVVAGGEPVSLAMYQAAPGEANQLSVTYTAGTLSLSDAGATITTSSPGCLATDAHTVACVRGTYDADLDVDVDLGDQDDTESIAVGTGDASGPVFVSSRLGDGNDTVTGDNPGHDDGGAGDDQLTVTVPGGDLHGGTGDDVLTALAGRSRLDGGPGFDRMHGGSGHDDLVSDLREEVQSGDCGPGDNDWVFVSGTARGTALPADCEFAALHKGRLIVRTTPIAASRRSLTFRVNGLWSEPKAALYSTDGKLLAPSVDVRLRYPLSAVTFTLNARGRRVVAGGGPVRVALARTPGDYFTVARSRF